MAILLNPISHNYTLMSPERVPYGDCLTILWVLIDCSIGHDGVLYKYLLTSL